MSDHDVMFEGADGAARHDGSRLRILDMTPRQAFVLLAIVLGVVFFSLLAYLIFLLTARTTPGVVGGDPGGGLKPVLTIEGPGRGVHPTFDRPLGVAVGREGRIYVTDTGNDRVCAFDDEGRFLFEFGGLGVAKPLPGGKLTWKPGRLDFPVGIDTDENGDVYVADFRNDQIQVFDADGRYIRSFPSPYEPTGKGSSGQDGKGIAVTDVAVRDGLVYATDSYQIFVFTTRGKLVRQFGRPGRGEGDLDHPNGVAADRAGNVYVSDSNHTRVVAFDRNGEPLWSTGRTPRDAQDQKARTFGLPRGLTVLSDGSVLVADAFDFDLVRLSGENGSVKGRYGRQGGEPGQFAFPNDVEEADGELYVADKENDRVQVLMFEGR